MTTEARTTVSHHTDADWFRTLAESAWFAVFVYRGNRFFYVNRATCELTGYDQRELLRLGPEDVLHPDSRARVPRINPRSGLYPSVTEPIEVEVIRRDGSTRWLALTTGTVYFKGFTAGLGSAVDITAQKRTQAALNRSLETESILTEISHRLMQLEFTQLDEGIRTALRRIGQPSHADHCAMFWFSDDTTSAEVTHEWCDHGVTSPVTGSDAFLGGGCHWLVNQLESRNVIAARCPADLPEQAREERSGLESAGIKSFAAVPFHVAGRLRGFVSLATLREQRTWDADDLRLLRVAGEMVGSTVHRLRTERELHASRERLELAQLAGRSVAWEWDVTSDRMVFSSSAASLFGGDLVTVPATGSELLEWIPAADAARISAALREVLRNGIPYSIEHRVVDSQGRDRWLVVRGQAQHGSDGSVTKVVGVSADITERKEAELALRREKERALVTLSSIADGVIRTDSDGRVDFLNPAAERLTGCRLELAAGRKLAEIYRVIDEYSRRLRPDPVTLCLAERRVIEPVGSCLLRREDGSEFAVRDSAAPLLDPDGAAVGAVLVVQDVTRVRGLEREMAYLATHDPLTGLINRREFERRLDGAVRGASETGQAHCLCYLDLDDFKILNDTCGHVAGDELLRQLTGVLAASIPREDTIARLGGDEFGLLLRNCGLEEGRSTAETVLDAVRQFRFLWLDKVFEVRASIGIVPVNRRSGSLSELLSASDAACYVAKDSGRNRVHLSEPDDAEIAIRYSEMNWVQRINTALEEDRFVLYGQPIRALQPQHREEFVEVLLRLVDEAGEIIAPDQFLTAAERYRIMPAIDRWVVREAFAAIARGAHPSATFAINLSGQTFGDQGLLELIEELMQQHAIDGHRLCFEITETTAIANLATARTFIDSLRARGCRFVLDDFGSGLSSFRYLRSLPVSLLKIDGEIVRHVASDPIQREMVIAIRRIGETMGLGTIGEWVENRAVAETLRDIGIDYAQGFWIARPRPLSDETPEPREP